jgi:hypothetical protein
MRLAIKWIEGWVGAPLRLGKQARLQGGMLGVLPGACMRHGHP